jgi:hypothetical protein
MYGNSKILKRIFPAGIITIVGSLDLCALADRGTEGGLECRGPPLEALPPPSHRGAPYIPDPLCPSVRERAQV